MLLVVSLLVMAVVWKSYRAGERWSWYALWSLPLGLGLALALVLGNGGASWPLWVILLTIALLGLLLPYGTFFEGA